MTDDCWEWPLGRTADGYGELVWEGTTRYAHRVMMEEAGHDLDGKVVRHRCDNPCCVNPGHLEVGTHSENQQDACERGDKDTKLGPDDVRAIRADDRTQGEIADEYGVTRSNVGKIQRRETWTQV